MGPKHFIPSEVNIQIELSHKPQYKTLGVPNLKSSVNHNVNVTNWIRVFCFEIINIKADWNPLAWKEQRWIIEQTMLMQHFCSQTAKYISRADYVFSAITSSTDFSLFLCFSGPNSAHKCNQLLLFFWIHIWSHKFLWRLLYGNELVVLTYKDINLILP